jgi:hypothetical protein
VPDGPEPLQYLAKYSHRAVRREELEKRCLSEVDGDVLHAEAEEGYAALSVLLGDDIYFFSDRYALIRVINVDGQDYWMPRCLLIHGQSLINSENPNWRQS